MTLAIPLLTLLALLPGTYSHGYMTTPAARHSLHCPQNNVIDCSNNVANVKKWNDVAKPLGDAVVPEPVCGMGSTDSKFQKGSSVATYNAGELIAVESMFNSKHGGHYAYRLCPDGSDTEACFSNNYLQNDQGQIWMTAPLNVVPHKTSSSKKNMIQLPAGISCNPCTLSWRWETFSTQWNPNQPGIENDGASVRVNCADIVIVGGSQIVAGGPAGGPAKGPAEKDQFLSNAFPSSPLKAAVALAWLGAITFATNLQSW